MARILYLDLQAGIAGDMFVAALLDLGVSLSELRAGLDGLGFGPLPVSVQRVMRGAFAAAHFVVEPPGPDAPHRSHAEIVRVIQAAPLAPRVRRRALAVFQRLAEAEGRLHGVPVESVHFHEVGAVDSIADVVGACIALEQLGVDRIVAGTPPLGHGAVRTAHGSMPLPAPATLALLEGWPVRPAPGPGEWVTPTGAALLAALAEPGPLPAMTLRGVGHGAGTRDGGPVANVLRAILGEPSAPPLAGDRVAVIEASVDDMPGEWWPPLRDALFAAGALDLCSTPGLGKKGRPVMSLRVLAPPGLAEAVGGALLAHSTTLGVRHRVEERWVLPRRVETVQTPYGPVRVKVVEPPGQPSRPSPEHEDCAALAREAGVSVAELHRATLAAWERA
jgi:uncharacterized protein (TIGR00299 family) protein